MIVQRMTAPYCCTDENVDTVDVLWMSEGIQEMVLYVSTC
jgi:hypothetical protein